MEGECVVVRGGAVATGATGLDYGLGITAESAGARALCLRVLRIPPGTRSSAHLHEGHESAAYLLEGEVVTWFGERLEQHAVVRRGDYVLIPAGVPHVAANYGSEEALAVLARSDPNAEESLVPLPELDSLPHLAAPPG